MKVLALKSLFNVIIVTACLVFSGATYAAVDTGTASLLARGDKVVTQYFSVQQQVKLPEVKASVQLAMTISPEKMREFHRTLQQIKTAHGRPLTVTGISQTTTSTGLINVVANLTVHLPVDELADVTALTKTYSKSGQRLTILNTVPYFSDLHRQAVENKLALMLYAKAMHFLKKLNTLTAPTVYTLGAIDYVPVDLQTPRPLVMMANTARVEGQAPVGMEKTLTLQASVTYIAFRRK